MKLTKKEWQLRYAEIEKAIDAALSASALPDEVHDSLRRAESTLGEEVYVKGEEHPFEATFNELEHCVETVSALSTKLDNVSHNLCELWSY